MDEDTLQQSLDLYMAQLRHVEQQVAAVGETEELKSLVSDLKELIALTEGSLLSLKKSQLLKSLEEAESPAEPCEPQPSTSVVSSSMDDEYALFQAALQEDDVTDKDTASATQSQVLSPPSDVLYQNYVPGPIDSANTSDTDGDSGDTSSDSENENGRVSKGENVIDEELSNLVGMKCCAPFSHDWGKLDFHNALVMSAVRDAQTDQILVKVMFTTPTHVSMQPCKFFLDGHCRFSEDKCKFSHGQTVELEKLREFVEADHSAITVDVKCLAQYTDGIWYPATVTEVKDDVVSVHFDDYGEDLDVDMTQVVPSVSQADDSSDSENEEVGPEPSASMGQGRAALVDSEEEEEEEELPVFLWRPPQTTAALGEWETHTRGIGSKLMNKMGYIPGQGLGVNGQGKAEPVPIMLLPQGKSLDRIMELKELAGNQDLFNAMKKLEKRQRKADRKQAEADNGSATAASTSASRSNVFDFINKKLTGKKGDLSSLTKSASHTSSKGAAGGDNKTTSGSSSRRHISEHELHKRSDKDINLQVFKTHEEIRNVERQIERLREQLTRNENKDRRVAAQVRGKLEEQEDYLRTLRSSSSALESHKKRRSNSKKLTVF